MTMDRKRKGLWLLIGGGLIVALGLAFFVSPFASSSPDGLNRVAIDHGFDSTQTDHATNDSPLAGYGVEGVENQSLSKGLSGIIGVAITFGIGMIIFGLLVRFRSKEPTKGAGAPPPAVTTGSA
ncbi:MAG: PDGLE domain-containing protein [Actinomycetota bacterium]